MSRRSDEATLRQIYEATAKIVQRVLDVTYGQFMSDEEKQDGIIRQLEIIGEAVGRITPDFGETHSHMMPWSEVKAMRNVLIHGYDQVNMDEVWELAIKDVPRLRNTIGSYLELKPKAIATRTVRDRQRSLGRPSYGQQCPDPFAPPAGQRAWAKMEVHLIIKRVPS